MSGTVLNTKLNVANNNSSGYPAYYGYADAGGHGGAAGASPSFTNANVKGLADEGVELYAYSDDGPATASPSLSSGTSITGYSYGVYAYAERDPHDNMVVANATASGLVSHSTIKGSSDVAIDLEAHNSGKGDAVVAPAVHASRIENTYDDGCFYLYAYKSSGATGTASVTPAMDTSYLLGSDDYCVEPDADGPGVVVGGGTSKAIVAGTYKNCTFDNPYYDAIDGAATNLGGTADMTPLIQDCIAITPDDNAYDLQANGYGTGDHRVYCAPTVLRGSAVDSANGHYFRAANDYGSLDSNAATSPVTCAPSIRDTSVYATWDCPIDTSAESRGNGTAYNNSYIYNTTAKGYYSLYNGAYCHEGPADAVNTARILGVSSSKRAAVEAFDGAGVENNASSQNGDATDRSQTKYLDINASSQGIYSNATCNGSGTTATCSPVISGNRIGVKWINNDYGIETYASGDHVVSSPSITSNLIGQVFGDGISSHVAPVADAKFTPTISGNTIGSGNAGVTGSGVHVYSTIHVGPGSKATITNNTITCPEHNGIQLEGGLAYGLVQANRIAYPGWYNTSTDANDLAGIYWNGADETSATGALVKGNMVKGARSGIAYVDGCATTQYNSFADMSGNIVQPWCLVTNKTMASPTEPKVDARYNWWNSTATPTIETAIYHYAYVGLGDGVVDYSSALKTCQPKLAGLSKSVSRTTLKFTLTFDRPMNRSIMTLRFGKTSPYNKYKATGTWNAAGTVWTGKFSPKSALTAGAKYYFSGAQDLPGTPMISTTKYFKP